ncbi:predicted membrane protein [Clostridium sp. CAG:58]|nr:predicted membrane protein [Clostridium sp. CAG:58]
MIQVHDRLSQSPLHLDSWRDTKLTGTVTAAESGTLFLSIPYDEGWTITIDGQPAEGEKILEAFLSVPVEAGTHEISLIYMPGGLVPGAILSGVSLAVLALLWLVKRRRSGRAGA